MKYERVLWGESSIQLFAKLTNLKKSSGIGVAGWSVVARTYYTREGRRWEVERKRLPPHRLPRKHFYFGERPLILSRQETGFH